MHVAQRVGGEVRSTAAGDNDRVNPIRESGGGDQGSGGPVLAQAAT
jgi:hypothetical protein